LKTGSFLFVRNGDFYIYKAHALLNQNLENVSFDNNNEPVANLNFYRIIDGNYIYVVYMQKESQEHDAEHMIVLLKDNVKLSGHLPLIKPYGQEHNKNKNNSVLIGGEIYFHDGDILLSNHKSGSFPSSPEIACQFILKIWGANGLDVFHPAVEETEVQNEVIRRKGIKMKNRVLPQNIIVPQEASTTSLGSPNAASPISHGRALEDPCIRVFSDLIPVSPGTSKDTLFVKRPNTVIEAPPQPSQCIPCVIL
ncbi:MAG: hypothetical protein PSV35_07190, partial [bacterium]|nr:hypothetical protein [bacterium]